MATKTTFRDLDVDVLLCIFDYFAANEIYAIFSESIRYLTPILRNSRIRLHLRHALIPQIDDGQVASMVFQRLPSAISFADFTGLRSLILHDIEDPRVLINQASFPALEIFHVKLSLRNKSDITLSLLLMITRLPRLISYTLIYPSSYFVILEDAILTARSSTTLKHLRLDVKCTIGGLKKLIRRLPSLRSLQARLESDHVDSIDATTETVLCPSIQDLHLTWNYIPFVKVLEFCQNMVNLKKCALNINDHKNEHILFHRNTWKRFIDIEHVLLQELSVNMKSVPSSQRGAPQELTNMLRDSYLRAIGFQFDQDHWNNILVRGHYVRLP